MYYKYHSLKLYYKKYGASNNTILILPGWGNTRKTFTYLIDNLKENYTIYIIDYPGFGKSTIPTTPLEMDDYAIIIKEFIKQNSIINPIIIAHSFGGRITSLLISKYNLRVKRLILLDVAGIKRRKKINVWLKEKTYKLLKQLVKLFPLIKQEELKQKLLFYFSSPDYQELPKAMHKTFQNIINKNLKKHYQNINTETLIIWGEKDQDTPLKDAYLLNKIIKNSALIVYQNSSHFSYLNKPYLTLKIIKEYLK